MAAFAVVHIVVPVAPHAGKFLGLRAVRAFRAPGVLDEPGSVAGRGVLGGDALGKAGGEVFLRVGVVPAYDGNCMVGGKGAGRVLRPIRAEVFGVVVKVGGNRAVRVVRDGHPATMVGLVGGVCIQLVFHDVDGRPVDAGIAAVLVKVAGLGQDVAVLKDVVRRVPPGKIVGIRAGLRIYGPVGIDGVALGVGEVDRITGFVDFEARVVIERVYLRLGEVHLNTCHVFRSFVDIHQVDGVVLRVVAVDAGVFVNRFAFGNRSDAGGEELGCIAAEAARAKAPVGIGGGGVKSLAGLCGSHDAFGRASVEEGCLGNLQFGEVEPGACVSLAVLRQDGRLAGGDIAEGPACAPAPLILDRRHHGIGAVAVAVGVAQVVLFGKGAFGGGVVDGGQGCGAGLADGVGLVAGCRSVFGGLGPGGQNVGLVGQGRGGEHSGKGGCQHEG